jgi:hypothetical protein
MRWQDVLSNPGERVLGTINAFSGKGEVVVLGTIGADNKFIPLIIRDSDGEGAIAATLADFDKVHDLATAMVEGGADIDYIGVDMGQGDKYAVVRIKNQHHPPCRDPSGPRLFFRCNPIRARQGAV